MALLFSFDVEACLIVKTETPREPVGKFTYHTR